MESICHKGQAHFYKATQKVHYPLCCLPYGAFDFLIETLGCVIEWTETQRNKDCRRGERQQTVISRSPLFFATFGNDRSKNIYKLQ